MKTAQQKREELAKKAKDEAKKQKALQKMLDEQRPAQVRKEFDDALKKIEGAINACPGYAVGVQLYDLFDENIERIREYLKHRGYHVSYENRFRDYEPGDWETMSIPACWITTFTISWHA